MSRGYTPRHAQTAGDLSFVVQFNDETLWHFAQLRYPRNRKDHSLWVTPFIPRERPNVKHAIDGYLRLPRPTSAPALMRVLHWLIRSIKQNWMKSGWMTSDMFLTFIQHFVKHVKPSKERPVLLLLDNHGTHINIDVVDIARENDIVILTFPPHCSHKLQPLERYYNAEGNSWMTINNYLRRSCNRRCSLSTSIFASIHPIRIPCKWVPSI